MGTCVVVMRRQTAGDVVWTMCILSLEDLGQANLDVSLGVDSFPLLQRNRGHRTGSEEENRYRLFGSASLSLKFHRWALTWGKKKTD